MTAPAFAVTRSAGVATVTIDRPPVNAFAADTYLQLTDVLASLAAADDVKVVVLSAADGARAWCGGADVNDFVGMNGDRRRDRYTIVNDAMRLLQSFPRPTIAALSAPAVGIGVLLAAACDLRIASASATFACPEIDYGLVAGSAKLLSDLGVPESLVREMGFTGRRVSAQRMMAAGFLNDLVEPAALGGTVARLAQTIAGKSLPALIARKQAYVEHEGMGWFDAYRLAQGLSATLVESADSQEGVSAFIEGRSVRILDR